MTNLSQVLGLDPLTDNLYGCSPCPKCQSEYRWPMNNDPGTKHPEKGLILCDDCGYQEPWIHMEVLTKVATALKRNNK